jgi:DNA-binding response OmpR family regulator
LKKKHKSFICFCRTTVHHASCRERSETWAFEKKAGKQELKVLLHVMASNPFREFTRKEFEEQLNDDDDDDEEREMMTMKVK